MSVDRDTHRTFLTDNGASEEMVDRTMTLMEPLFVNAENGTYPLMSKEALEADGFGPRFAEAIAKATGREVEEIIFISLEHPSPRPEWMSEEDCRNSLRTSLGCNLWDSLWDNLWESLGDSLGNNLRVKLWDSLGESLYGSLGYSQRGSLRDSIRVNLRDSLGESLGNSLGNSLWKSLYFLNGFALTNDNDKEKFERVAPLLELQTKGLVLANLKHAPRTWLVVCK